MPLFPLAFGPSNLSRQRSTARPLGNRLDADREAPASYVPVLIVGGANAWCGVGMISQTDAAALLAAGPSSVMFSSMGVVPLLRRQSPATVPGG